MPTEFYTAEHAYPTEGKPSEFVVERFAKPGDKAAMLTAPQAPDWPIAAWVSHGRWCVTCDEPRCGGSQYASYSHPWFMCVACGNRGRGWRPVTWPSDDDRGKIEAALSQRPPEARNWEPGESVENLDAESEAHADEINSWRADGSPELPMPPLPAHLMDRS